MGLFVFNTVQSRSWLKTLMTIFTLSVDELVAMPLPFFVGMYLYMYGSEVETQNVGRRLIRLMVRRPRSRSRSWKGRVRRPREAWRS
jgi:hypothetical protein